MLFLLLQTGSIFCINLFSVWDYFQQQHLCRQWFSLVDNHSLTHTHLLTALHCTVFLLGLAHDPYIRVERVTRFNVAFTRAPSTVILSLASFSIFLQQTSEFCLVLFTVLKIFRPLQSPTCIMNLRMFKNNQENQLIFILFSTIIPLV